MSASDIPGTVTMITVKMLILTLFLVVLWAGYQWLRKPKMLIETLTATEQDVADAKKYALRRLCEDKGFAFSENADRTAFRCDFTADTCVANSTYPPVLAADAADGLPRPYYEWNTDLDACILGIGEYRKKCEEMGMRYDNNKSKCFVTEQYCNCKGLHLKNGDCWKDPLNQLVSYITGDTLATTFTAVWNPAFYSCLINKSK